MYLTKINKDGSAKGCFINAVMVFNIIISLIALSAGNAQALSRGSGGLCGGDSLCKTLEGKEFDLIKYYSMGSALVVLYDGGKIGNLILFAPEFDYSRERGTISNAVDFLNGFPEVSGFTVLKGEKSAGWFNTEVIEGIYVIKPRYEVTSEYLAPDYSFVYKGGKIIMHITQLYDLNTDDD